MEEQSAQNSQSSERSGDVPIVVASQPLSHPYIISNHPFKDRKSTTNRPAHHKGTLAQFIFSGGSFRNLSRRISKSQLELQGIEDGWSFRLTRICMPSAHNITPSHIGSEILLIESYLQVC